MNKEKTNKSRMRKFLFRIDSKKFKAISDICYKHGVSKQKFFEMYLDNYLAKEWEFADEYKQEIKRLEKSQNENCLKSAIQKISEMKDSPLNKNEIEALNSYFKNLYNKKK